MRERVTRLAGAALAAAWLTGCPAPLSRGARAQEAAHELNINARFGRLNVAMERVAASERDAFARRHQAWGNELRVADTELAGMRLTKDDVAEVDVRVAWFRPDQGELHVTLLRQTWRDERGDWRLVREERAGGAPGLLGDGPATPAAGTPPGEPKPLRARSNAQFPTIRIGGDER